MDRKQTLAVAAAAFSGLLVGSANRVSAATTPAQANGSSGISAGHRIMLDDSKDDKHSCKGENACKGKGGCKTSDNDCKGKNSCKGKGGCKTNGDSSTSKPSTLVARFKF